jgi:glucose-6-phosphate isomerase
MKTISLTHRPAWQALENHYHAIKDVHMRDLFEEDPQRGERLNAQAIGLYMDYSKHRITDETLTLLLELARESGLEERRQAMFTGEKINLTEKRAVLHTALRGPQNAQITVDGQNVVLDVHAVLDKMTGFTERVRSGAWKGYTGKPICSVLS